MKRPEIKLNKGKVFIFKYDPLASPKRMFDHFKETVKIGKKHIQPKNIMIANSIETIYQIITKARLEILACLVKNDPENIYQLAQFLNKDYSNVWKDTKILANLGIIKLKKQDQEFRPIALYEQIIFDFYQPKEEKRIQQASL